MNRGFYYEAKTPQSRATCVVRFANFHLRYLMAKMMSDVAVRNNAALTVKRLTLQLAIKHKFFNIRLTAQIEKLLNKLFDWICK